MAIQISNHAVIWFLVYGGAAIVLGHRMATHYPWETQQAYAGLIIVVPLAMLFGITFADAIVGCAGLGVGFAAARNGWL